MSQPAGNDRCLRPVVKGAQVGRGESPGPTSRNAARDDRSAEALVRHAPRGDHSPGLSPNCSAAV